MPVSGYIVHMLASGDRNVRAWMGMWPLSVVIHFQPLASLLLLLRLQRQSLPPRFGLYFLTILYLVLYSIALAVTTHTHTHCRFTCYIAAFSVPLVESVAKIDSSSCRFILPRWKPNWSSWARKVGCMLKQRCRIYTKEGDDALLDEAWR